MGFFDKILYGNTISEWAIAIAILVGAILLSKVVYLLISRTAKRITKNTKSRLDDIVIDKLEEPIVFAIIVFGIWYGLSILNMSGWFNGLKGHALYFVLTFNIAWFIVRLFNALIDEYLLPIVEKSETDMDDQILPIAQKTISISIWVLAVIIGLDNAGYDVTALIAGLGLGSLAFALAAKDSVSHLFGGIVLFSDQPFKINDRIVTKGYDGIVKEIGIRSTRIQTLDGRMVTLPNGSIANDSVVNISSEAARKTTIDLGLTYDTTPERMQLAMKILMDISAANKNIEHNRTVAAFTSFGDFSLNIRYIYYIKKGANIFGMMTEMNTEILKQFNNNKLEFAFPTQTLYTVNDK